MTLKITLVTQVEAALKRETSLHRLAHQVQHLRCVFAGDQQDGDVDGVDEDEES